MGKTDVYSWRISPETKSALELEARREGASMAALLERIANEWLEARRESSVSQEVEQIRLHRSAAKALGTIAGGNSRRAEQVRFVLRERVARRHGR